MITGISSNSQSSNALTNSPLAAPVAIPRGAAPIGSSLPYFDSFSAGSSWIGDLTQIVSQVEEFIFGFDAQNASKQALQSLLSFSSELLSGLTSGTPETIRADVSRSGQSSVFQALFPYSDLSLIPVATSGDAKQSGSSLLDILANSAQDTRGESFKSDTLRNGGNPQSAPTPTNPLLFRTSPQTEHQRARGGADPARPIPWEERKKRKENRRRESLVGKTLGRLQSGLIRLVKRVTDALAN